MLVVLYLFLGGAGAGACAVAALLGLSCPRAAVSVEVPCAVRLAQGSVGAARLFAGAFLGERDGTLRRTRLVLRAPSIYRRLMVPAFSAALVAMTVGIACLFFDLGRSDRVVLLLISPALTHISVGAWALAATALLAALLLCAWNAASFCFPLGVVRALEALVLAAAFVSMAYTGLLLQGLNAVPLWGSVWLPVVFVLSSVSCGLAIVAAAAQVSDAAELFAAALRRLTAADAVVIAVEAVAAGLLVASVMQLASAQGAFDNTATVAAASATELLSGGSAWVFWGVFFAVGLAVPLVAEAVLLVQSRRGGRIPVKASLAVSCCVLAGGFALRFCLIQAGAHPFAYLPIA